MQDVPLLSSALIIGTGAYARVVAARLREMGCSQLQVFSPSGRAAAFAATHNAEVVNADDLVEAMAKADLVVTCSGQQDSVVKVDTVQRARNLRPTDLMLVDLALHPDVAGEVKALPGVRVVDLHTVADEVPAEHREAIVAAQDIVIDAVAKFEEDQAIRTLDPAVVALRRHVSGTVQKEMDRLRSKYPADIAADVELALHRVTQSLLHTPTLRAKELARTGDSADYLQALHTLFGIEIPAPVTDP
jgi:glutamyl-tRNA reductase